MKKTALTLLVLLFTFTACVNGQFATVLVENSDPQPPIVIPEGKVLEIKNFTQYGGSGYLVLTMGASTMQVLTSAGPVSGANAGTGHAFVGPASIQIVRDAGKVCLTYRMFDNEDPDAAPVQPTVQVRTICRCRRGR